MKAMVIETTGNLVGTGEALHSAALPGGARLVICGLSAGLAIFLAGCGVHTSDSEMISFFHAHEAAFGRLATMAQEDVEFHAVTLDSVFLKCGEDNWTDAGPQARSGQRWAEYQSMFRELRLPQGFARDRSKLYFLFDEVSIWNGASSKGYVYSEEPLPACSSDLSVCEQRAPVVYGTMVYKLIKPGWYLWLHYDG